MLVWRSNTIKTIVDKINFILLSELADRTDVDKDAGIRKYGSVKFADPKNHKYPIDTVKHIRAAWSYINMPKNAEKYSDADVRTIKAAIIKAWRSDINPGGPKSAAVDE